MLHFGVTRGEEVELAKKDKDIPCIGQGHSHQLEEDLEALYMLCGRNCLRGFSHEPWIEVHRAGARIALSLFKTHAKLPDGLTK
jgi:hypothetical protein